MKSWIRNLAIGKAKAITGAEQVELIDSYRPDLADLNPIYALGETLKYMMDADFVYFAKGWEKYRGCRVEHCVAINYEIPFYEE